jgi:hypothetical protein
VQAIVDGSLSLTIVAPAFHDCGVHLKLSGRRAKTHLPVRIPIDLRQELHLRSDRLGLEYRRWLKELGITYGTLGDEPPELCVPKTLSALISRRNHLTSVDHVRTVLLRPGRLGLAIQVAEPT